MKKITDEQEKDIIRLYPEHSGKWIAQKVGISYSDMRAIVRTHGLRHTEETTRRLKLEILERARAARTEETARKISKTVKTLRRQETLRLMSGQKQLTKLHICLLPQKTRNRMSGLVTARHYFRGNDINRCVLYYDEQTKRSSRAEEYATKHYGIVFKSAMEEPDDE